MSGGVLQVATREQYSISTERGRKPSESEKRTHLDSRVVYASEEGLSAQNALDDIPPGFDGLVFSFLRLVLAPPAVLEDAPHSSDLLEEGSDHFFHADGRTGGEHDGVGEEAREVE